MTYDILAVSWNKRFGNKMCPCGCYDKAPYATSYRININTKSMQGYGDPFVDDIQVWCKDCDSYETYKIDDGYSRVSDYNI